MVLPLLSQDARSAARLRRMKTSATALLLVAAALYLASLRFDGTAIGFVRAGSEAAMIGGLADWFAVTALFRHPLGLPIPHTALVPRKKDELATKLGEFVTGHFLTREVVVQQVAEAGIVVKIGEWLAEPANAALVAKEAAYTTGVLLEQLDDAAVVDSVLEFLRRDLARRSSAPVLGRVLERALAGGSQGPLVEVLAGRTHRYLRANVDQLVPEVRGFAERRGWIAWLLATDKRVRKGLLDVADIVEQVEQDARHDLRLWLDGLLADLATELQHDPATAAKIDQLVSRLVEDARAQAVLHDVVTDAMASIRESLSDAKGGLQDRIAVLVKQLGQRAVDDDVFRGRIERVLEGVVGHAVERYGSELTALIRRQVAAWDATAASRNIELAVGRDLQFIRINGTFVGALAGLVIHGVTLAVS